MRKSGYAMSSGEPVRNERRTSGSERRRETESRNALRRSSPTLRMSLYTKGLEKGKFTYPSVPAKAGMGEAVAVMLALIGYQFNRQYRESGSQPPAYG